MVVTVTANYANANNYPSPIGVADDPDWRTTYGTVIPGTTVDNDNGSMSAAVTVQKAGTYSLRVSIDGADVYESPF